MAAGIKLDQVEQEASAYAEAVLLGTDWKFLLGEQHLSKTFSVNTGRSSVMAVYPIPINTRPCYAVVSLASQDSTFHMYKCILPTYIEFSPYFF